MKIAVKAIVATILVSLSFEVSAQSKEYGQDAYFKIWDNTTAPHTNNLTGESREVKPHKVVNVTTTELFIFRAKKNKATGQSVVICPGGGYYLLSMDQEGIDMAKWFAKNGITAAVLQYRNANGVKDIPFEDAVEAIKIMRKEHQFINIDPDKIGIVGSSAGGHLASWVSAAAPDEARPNFSILFYPVITSEVGKGHQGSFDNLLGKKRSKKESTLCSVEMLVDKKTPPAILFHCDDDKVVPSVNSTLYYNALKEFKTEASLHIYPSGGHGWGVNDYFKYHKEWRKSLIDWLNKID